MRMDQEYYDAEKRRRMPSDIIGLVIIVSLIVFFLWNLPDHDTVRRNAIEMSRHNGKVAISVSGEKGVIQSRSYDGSYVVRDKNGWFVRWPAIEVRSVE